MSIHEAIDALYLYRGTRRDRRAMGAWAARIVARALTDRERKVFAARLEALRTGDLSPQEAARFAEILRNTLPD